MRIGKLGALVGAGAIACAVVAGAQAVDEITKPQPGKYNSDITLIDANIPGLPKQMLGVIKQRMSRSTEICLTAEEVEEGYKQALARTQDGECTYERFNATGGTIDAVMICESPNGPMTMTMNGTGTPTNSDVTMNVVGNMGRGEGSMTMRVVQKRIGDC
ncbi:MAG: DUF3617 domain-containing protein [Pseudomonadota bacterium]